MNRYVKPKIYAKAALTEEQIITKMNIGCDGLEIQLLGELIKDRTCGKYNRALDVFDMDALIKYPVKAVHAPLVPGKGDVTLEFLTNSTNITLLDQIFLIAELYGEEWNEMVTVILHSESFYKSLVDVGNQWGRVVSYIGMMLDKYPNTKLVIENVTPLRGIEQGKELHLSNNWGFDNIKMVQELRKALNINRIFTCLDTCHAMLAEKYIGGLYEIVGDVPVPNLSMEEYFRRNAPYLGLIHLCDVKGSGYGKGRHGIPFTNETIYKCYDILSLYEKYSLCCPITLEVEETDFAISDGYVNTKAIVDSFYKSNYRKGIF